MALDASSMLVVVFGLPGTGKTTMAQKLAKTLNAEHLNTDKLRGVLGKRDQYSETDKQAVYRTLLELAEAHLENGQDLVLDGTFSRKAYRESIRQIAVRTGASLKWIRTLAAEDVVRSRVEEQRPFSQADFKIYQKIRDEFEPVEETALELWRRAETQEESLVQMRQFLNG